VSNTIKKHVLLSCILGNAISMYDFFIFGVATALVFGKLFFPDHGFLIPLLVFAVGFVIRLLGSAVYGHLGDKFGRKKILISTLLLTGGSTVIIGLLPTYETIGIWAPILLIACRVVQTFAFGGEWAAANVMVLEQNSKSPQRGFFGSMVASGFVIATVLSSVMWALVSSQGQEFLMSWGWRIPFLASGLLLVLGIYARAKLLETPDFLNNKQNQVKSPIVSLFKNHWKMIIPAVGMQQISGAFIYSVSIFGMAYLVSKHGMSRADLNLQWLYIMPVTLASILFFGWLGDKIGRLNVYLIGAVASVAISYPIFHWLSIGNFLLPALFGAAFVSMLFWSQGASFLLEIFPTEVRQTGGGVIFGLGGVVGGGIVPLIAQSLMTNYGIMSVAYLLLVMSFIALGSVIWLRRYKSLSNG
jgi:MFS family permease